MKTKIRLGSNITQMILAYIENFNFFSAFYQAKEAIINPEIKTMLEFGTGRNLTKAMVEHYGISHKSVDFDNKKYIPDEVSTILNYRDKNKYDIVCAFQVLEHNPLESVKSNLKKMMNLSNKNVYIYFSSIQRRIHLVYHLSFNFFPGKFGYFNKQLNLNWGRLFKKTRPTGI